MQRLLPFGLLYVTACGIQEYSDRLYPTEIFAPFRSTLNFEIGTVFGSFRMTWLLVL